MTPKTLVRQGSREEYQEALSDLRYGECCSDTREIISSYVRDLECAIDSFLMGDCDMARTHLSKADFDMTRPLRHSEGAHWYLHRSGLKLRNGGIHQ
jgi:hypothetical protein